ncbi:hypothetical protein OGAPHI_005787 [Ogataea philodendri]|uniref:Sterol-4-alpha-carboxylate 3-dehydrogenase ERG26, decarboxylating n=1 Tax=Ogataea philodendri TaxID=1378263 RepID=A0A9P8NZF8_9ASCO|nr:uncharacterized protein OGAPHI_005787 [Ogataea philodendri]KAH3662535.1 hypothetical protein OGAPHI_005787 [Ogataea philodendri]
MSIDSVILVGGAGFLGLHLIEQFWRLDNCPKISVFDVRPLPEKISSYFSFDPAQIDVFVGDLTSEKDVKDAIEKFRPDVIVHSASPMHGLAQEIYEKVNVQGTANLIKCSREMKIQSLVYTSSAGVIFNGQDIYNADERWPIPEIPMDGYNETKATAEKMVMEANSPKDNFYTVSLRPAGIFGPGDRQLVPGLRQVLKNGQSKFQVGDNNNLFDWTYAGNVADAHVFAAQKLQEAKSRELIGGETFFITNDSPTYFWTLARTVWKADGHIDKRNIVLSRSVAIAIGYVSEKVCALIGKEAGLTPFRVKVACANRYHNISKAKELLGYKPRVSIADGIKYTLDWMDEAKA